MFSINKYSFMILSFVTTLLGCSNDVDLVKSGTTKLDGNVRTLSEVFSNWSHCTNVKWEKFDSIAEEDRTVTVECDLKLFVSTEEEKEYSSEAFKSISIKYWFDINGERFDLDRTSLFASWVDGLFCFGRFDGSPDDIHIKNLYAAYDNEMVFRGDRLQAYRFMRHSAEMTRDTESFQDANECFNETAMQTFKVPKESSAVAELKPEKDVSDLNDEVMVGMAQLATVPSDAGYTNRDWGEVPFVIDPLVSAYETDWQYSDNDKGQTIWTADADGVRLKVLGNRTMITDTEISSHNPSGEVSLSQRFERLATSETLCDTARMASYEERFAIIKIAGNKPVYAKYQLSAGSGGVYEWVYFGRYPQYEYPQLGGESTMGGTWVSCD